MDHLSDEQMQQKLAEAAKLVTVGAEYQHYKQKLYKVVLLAFIEETMEVGVVYQELHGSYTHYIRPLSNWLETAEVNGKKVPRFAKVEADVI